MSESQKFIARHRAPRVQIEYDVELYGAEKKVQLPFVMGVFSDLSGKSEKPTVGDRKFLEIDVDNFDDRMKSVAPRAAFTVPNTLTGEGNLSIDMTFEKMSDFSPEAIAAKTESLAPLLEARKQLSDLMAYMDGKSGAEALIEKMLGNTALLAAVGGASEGGADTDAALASLRAVELPAEEADTTDATLTALADAAPDETEPDTSVADALGTLSPPPEDTDQGDAASDVLAGIERVEIAEEVDKTRDILAAVEAVEVEEVEDTTDDVLKSVEATDTQEPEDNTDDILAGVEAAEVEEDEDTADAVLNAIEAPPTEEDVDQTDDILGSVEALEIEEPEDQTDDILASVEAIEAEEVEDTTDDVLDTIEAVAVAEETDQTDDILDSIEEIAADAPVDKTDDILAGVDAVETEEDADTTEDVLGSIEAVDVADSDDQTDDVLANIDSIEVAEDVDTTDDVLSAIEEVEANAVDDQVDDILGDIEAVEASEDIDTSDDVLGSIEAVDPETPEDDLDDILAGINVAETAEDEDVTDDVLAGIEAVTEPEEEDKTESVLGGIEAVEEPVEEDDLDDILGGLESDVTLDEGSDDLDDILGSIENDETPGEVGDDLDDILGALDSGGEEKSDADDLDDILGSLESDETPDDDSEDLDDILGALDDDNDTEESEADDLDDILGALDGDDDLDSLLSDLDSDDDTDSGDLEDILSALDDSADEPSEIEAEQSEPMPPKQSPFGRISAERPQRGDLKRNKFRIALLGDFSGRSAKGVIEIGEELRNRKPIELDVDTVEDVIEQFATTLTLPIGKDGSGVQVPVKELDDLHPDELFDNLEIFEAIKGLRQQLNVGSMADKAGAMLKEWAEAHGTPIKLPKTSAATNIPADRKLSDFQALIGDTSGTLTEVGPIDGLLAQIVGPHVVKAPDAGAEAMKSAVDDALSSAMRLVLHHPDFQAIEALWRSLDLLARRIETNSDLQIILYDISAEELAADLAAQEDLAESGLFGLLNDAIDPEEGTGGFSALCGLYTFEETPPHAELLARIGQVGAHVDAPFFAAMTPNYLETAKEDRHPLVADAWDTLRDMPEAHYIALSSPRFLLRLPYGAKSEPIYPFDFEEFTPQAGLRGMLWANPTVLTMILLAGTYTKDGKAMDLGSLMSLGDLPFHFVTDRHGDQVALPCTERNLTSDAAQATLGRGFMPVVWIKGRNEIRLGSFCSLAGSMIAGPWEAEVPKPRKQPGEVTGEIQFSADVAAPESSEEDPAVDEENDDTMAELADDDLDGLLDGLDDASEDDDIDLDDLLAGFGDDDDSDDDAEDDEMDEDLAALLEGL